MQLPIFSHHLQREKGQAKDDLNVEQAGSKSKTTNKNDENKMMNIINNKIYISWNTQEL